MFIPISSREVNRALRSRIWPGLREHGFVERTQRTAWSDREGCVAVVNFRSFNSRIAGRLGVTTFSFGLNLGVRALCSSRYQSQVKVKNDKRRDGSNLEEVVEDARSVLLTTGLEWLDEFSDLQRILRFAESEPEEWDGGWHVGTWGLGQLGCPNRLELIADIRQTLEI